MRLPFNIKVGVTRPFGVYGAEYANYPDSKHSGTDYNLPANTPLVAAMSGTVTATPRAGSVGRGNEVIITSNNIQAKTCHMNRIDKPTGVQVQEGEMIGLSGNTGYVLPAPTPQFPNNGAHLHFEVMVNGQYVDPEIITKGEDVNVTEATALRDWVLGMDLSPDDPGFKEFKKYWIGKPQEQMQDWLLNTDRHKDIVTKARKYSALENKNAVLEARIEKLGKPIELTPGSVYIAPV